MKILSKIGGIKKIQKPQKILMFLFLISGLLSCVPKKPEEPTPTTGGETPGKVQDDKVIENATYNTTAITPVTIAPNSNDFTYKPAGIGGGGAMSGISMSPYSSLWFVGTDMGTLFRSVDNGRTWRGVNHNQTTYSSSLPNSVGIGFSSNPNIVFHAPAGMSPVRSTDAGRTWNPITMDLGTDEKIRYWKSHSYDNRYMYVATSNGLLQSSDTGLTWTRLPVQTGESTGTYIDYSSIGTIIYHATAAGIYRSVDLGKTFKPFFQLAGTSVRAFSAGRDSTAVTFAFIDGDGRIACSDMEQFAGEVSPDNLNAHYAHCGYVWIAHADGKFIKTTQIGGDFVRLAENDSKTLYVTGSISWIRDYGTKVWRSTDSGKNWTLKLHQYNWDQAPYLPWGQDKIEYSAVAMDVGWWDGGYISYDVNLRKSSTTAGTGLFFLFSSTNSGDFWNAPFTKYADTGAVAPRKRFESTGLEMTSVYRFKFHPSNPQLGYAAMADVGGIQTEDGGKTFRICKTEYNSNYDYAFDPADQNLVWAAAGAVHDYPMEWHANAMVAEGGIYASHDRGLSWTRMTPRTTSFNRQFLAVQFDPIHEVLYAGSQGDGVAISRDRGATWAYMNTGLPAGDKIIPQIEIDPVSGDAYALLAGNAPNFTNYAATGIYILEAGTSRWKLLRGTVVRHPDIETGYKLWYYPTSFAVDFSVGSDRKTLWLTDYENNGNWLATGIWKSTDEGLTWNRMSQYTHPTSIVLDQDNPDNVYVGGLLQWGNGGAYSSKDGGATWSQNDKIPYQKNSRSTTLDPNDSSKLFYTFFGSGMLYGPRP